jgi:hypothetical protein
MARGTAKTGQFNFQSVTDGTSAAAQNGDFSMSRWPLPCETTPILRKVGGAAMSPGTKRKCANRSGSGGAADTNFDCRTVGTMDRTRGDQVAKRHHVLMVSSCAFTPRPACPSRSSRCWSPDCGFGQWVLCLYRRGRLKSLSCTARHTFCPPEANSFTPSRRRSKLKVPS